MAQSWKWVGTRLSRALPALKRLISVSWVRVAFHLALDSSQLSWAFFTLALEAQVGNGNKWRHRRGARSPAQIFALIKHEY